jgi:hypothetical protein
MTLLVVAFLLLALSLGLLLALLSVLRDWSECHDQDDPVFHDSGPVFHDQVADYAERRLRRT